MNANPIPVSHATRVVFVAPPPGLAPLVDFDLAPVEGAVGLSALRAVAVSDIRLFLVDPAQYVPEYVPNVRPDQLAAVGAANLEDVQIHVVATIIEDAPVVNLIAPILVNPLTWSAAQVILDGDDWPLQAPLAAFGD